MWFARKLRRLNPPAEMLEWYKTQKNYEAAWMNCHRGDWMLWLLSHKVDSVHHYTGGKILEAVLEFLKPYNYMVGPEAKVKLEGYVDRVKEFVKAPREFEEATQVYCSLSDLQEESQKELDELAKEGLYGWMGVKAYGRICEINYIEFVKYAVTTILSGVLNTSAPDNIVKMISVLPLAHMFESIYDREGELKRLAGIVRRVSPVAPPPRSDRNDSYTALI